MVSQQIFTKCPPFPLHSSPSHPPHTVTNLRVVNTTTNSATITWDQPPHNYRVFLHGEATDNIPQSRVINETNVTGQTTHVVQGLNSFRNYSIGVYLESDHGKGSNATVIVHTTGRGEEILCMSMCVGAHVSAVFVWRAESTISHFQIMHWITSNMHNWYVQHQMPAPPNALQLPQAGQSPCSGVHLLYSTGMAYWLTTWWCWLTRPGA